MVRIEDNQIIMELSEGEAKLATRLMPLLGPILELYFRINMKVIFDMALLDKDKREEVFRRIESGERGVLAKVNLANQEGFARSLADKILKDFPGPEEIEKLLGALG